MTKLVWDKIEERFYEAGVNHGILFVQGDDGKYGKGVAWSGLTKITTKPEGGEEEGKYADNIKYLSLLSDEELKGTIEAYTYPDEFGVCDGSVQLAKGIRIGQQPRRTFALVWSSSIGNSTKALAYSERINIVYGCKASPSERSNETINEKADAATMSWDFTTTKVEVNDEVKPTSYVSISKVEAGDEAFKKVIDALQGSEDSESGILMPADIAAMGIQLETTPKEG